VGKSNVVDAFALLGEAMASPLDMVFARRGGIPAICHRFGAEGFSIEVTFGAIGEEDIEGGRYGFDIAVVESQGAFQTYEVTREHCQVRTRTGIRSFDRGESGAFSSTEGVYPYLQTTALVMPLVGGHLSFAPVLRLLSRLRVYSIDPSKMRQWDAPGGGPSLSLDGANAASVLQEIERTSPGEIERIDEFLSAVLPHETQVRSRQLGDTVRLEISLKAKEQPATFKAVSMSDGTLRFLGLLLSVFQLPTPSLVVFEEPEATIHPAALGAVMDLIRLASHKTQVCVTTHSPDLLDSAQWIEDRHLRVVTMEDGATRVTAVEQASRTALSEHLMGPGELLRSNLLEPAVHSKANAA
jgi:predicted ATPase